MKKIITLTFSIIVIGILNNSVLAQESTTTNNSEMLVQEQKPAFNNDGINSDEEKTSIQQYNQYIPLEQDAYQYIVPRLEQYYDPYYDPYTTVPPRKEEINILEPLSNNNCQITKEQRRQSKKMLEEIRNRLNTEDFHEFVTYEPKNCDFKKLSYRERVYQSILP
jgi:hypothetical protein